MGTSLGGYRQTHTIPKAIADRVNEEENKPNTRRVYTAQGKVEEIGENSATVRLVPLYAQEEWEVPMEFLKSAI